MFSKVVFFVATMAAFVAATPIPGASNQCNTGSLQCCNSVYQSQSQEGALLASLVGLNVQDLTGSIGANCSPLSVVGAGSGAQWCVTSLGDIDNADRKYSSQQPVCCSNNSFSMFLTCRLVFLQELITNTIPYCRGSRCGWLLPDRCLVKSYLGCLYKAVESLKCIRLEYFAYRI